MNRLLVALLFFAGCDSAERKDSEVVLSAIQRFRTAPNESLPAMVDALKATPCQQPDSCKARDECVSLGSATVTAFRLKSEVEKTLTGVEKGTIAHDSIEAQTIDKKLEAATAAINDSKGALQRCDDAVQTLRQKHY